MANQFKLQCSVQLEHFCLEQRNLKMSSRLKKFPVSCLYNLTSPEIPNEQQETYSKRRKLAELDVAIMTCANKLIQRQTLNVLHWVDEIPGLFIKASYTH